MREVDVYFFSYDFLFFDGSFFGYLEGGGGVFNWVFWSLVDFKYKVRCNYYYFDILVYWLVDFFKLELFRVELR